MAAMCQHALGATYTSIRHGLEFAPSFSVDETNAILWPLRADFT